MSKDGIKKKTPVKLGLRRKATAAKGRSRKKGISAKDKALVDRTREELLGELNSPGEKISRSKKIADLKEAVKRKKIKIRPKKIAERIMILEGMPQGKTRK